LEIDFVGVRITRLGGKLDLLRSKQVHEDPRTSPCAVFACWPLLISLRAPALGLQWRYGVPDGKRHTAQTLATRMPNKNTSIETTPARVCLSRQRSKPYRLAHHNNNPKPFI
jgi:hypothetical protein